MNKELTKTEQNLLDELNYKASLIIELEKMFESKDVPVNSKSLYAFSIKELETVKKVWIGKES